METQEFATADVCAEIECTSCANPFSVTEDFSFTVPKPLKPKKRTVAPANETNVEPKKPKATKKIKLSDSDGREVILKYMTEQVGPVR